MDQKVIANLRSLSIDMINEAGSGHPGISLSAAPLIYTVFSYHLKFNPKNPLWINRDRFIMSPGHGSALLYSMLFLSGYDITYNDLKSYRKLNSILTGHPKYNPNIGIELTTGALGQGFASSVGIALGEKYLKTVISRELFDFYTYVIVSDGDLMEGISYEAASFAGTNKLGKLIVLYDSNDMTLDGETKNVFEDDTIKLFESLNWDVHYVSSSEDIKAINKAITDSKKELNKPSLIKIKTKLGFGSVLEGKKEAHGKPFTEEQISLLKKELDVTPIPFFVSKEKTEEFRNNIYNRNNPLYNEWETKYNSAINNSADNIKSLFKTLETGNMNINLNSLKINLKPGEERELRELNGSVMNIISSLTPLFLGGSADVMASTKTKINNLDIKNISYGTRENVMGAISNGLATLNLRPFASTFLTFSDYLKPSIRNTALMNLPVTYIFTHDSILIGEDGETHAPVEQLGMLRSIPNMTLFRPSDIKELIGSWDYIINNKVPSSLVISKNKYSMIEWTDSNLTKKGGYILKDSPLSRIDAIIVASGSEVHIALELRNLLMRDAKGVRVISMPSLELFEKQPQEYKDQLFIKGIKTIVLEFSNDTKWLNYVYNDKYLINVKTFGISADKNDALNYFNLDIKSLEIKVKELIK